MEHINQPIDKMGTIKTISNDIGLLTAVSKVAEGDYDGAEALLCQKGDALLSVEETELLARIAVQRGDWQRAMQFWSMALEKDPQRESAQRALSRMRGPWIQWALLRRLAYLSILGVVGCLSVTGIVALVYSDGLRIEGTQDTVMPDYSQKSTGIISTRQVGESQPGDATHGAEPGAAFAIKKASTALISAAPPVLDIPGCRVTANADETRIIFEEGIFAYRAEFTDSGRGQLEVAAKLLAHYADSCRIIVEGHTDSDSMPPNSVYKDNYVLGLYRAIAAAEVIRAVIPASGIRISIESTADKDPPFPGDDNASKLKNRTVVLRLAPQ